MVVAYQSQPIPYSESFKLTFWYCILVHLYHEYELWAVLKIDCSLDVGGHGNSHVFSTDI